jgi:hypothetical protein
VDDISCKQHPLVVKDTKKEKLIFTVMLKNLSYTVMVLKSCHNTKTINQLENKKRHHHTKICEKYKTKVCRPNKMKKK